MGIIYLLTCIKSGKSYVGQTIQTFNQRWSDHKTSARNLNKKDGCRALNNALRLYNNWDSDWLTQVLFDEECTKEDLDEMEIYFVKEYDTLAPNGYNLRTGGQSRGKVSEETRELMSSAAKKRNSDIYRKNTQLNGLKYLNEWCNDGKFGYVIHRHPAAPKRYFYFTSRNQSKMQWNLDRAKTRLEELNAQAGLSAVDLHECSSETKCSSGSSQEDS